MRKTKFLAGLLAAGMLAAQLFPLQAQADAYKVVTLGANLSEEQKASILRFFGVSEGEVEILVITNEDERAQLQELIPIEQIGTRTYSCALVNPTTSGGIQVKTANMNYVTSNMIASTLSTSGVVNCDVLTAAPFEVSGTGALTGVMMAYETASGETLDQKKKELANEELVTTNQIADTVGQDEATLIVNDIKIHIIRDEVKDQETVNTVVDTVVDTAETAMQARAADTGGEQPGKLEQGDRQLLYSFGYKVAQADYKYDDVKVTLQRVAQNVAETTGIEDPILQTFEPLEDAQLDTDSILMNTDDEALGGDTQINATSQDAVAGDAQEALAGLPDQIQGDGVSLEKVTTLQDVRLIYNTNLLQLDDSPGDAMADLSGTALTGSLYGGFSAVQGYILAYQQSEDPNCYGLFDQNGAVRIPFQYGNIDVENEHWALAAVLAEATADNYDVEDSYNKKYYLIDRVDLYYLEEGGATLVAALTRGQIADCHGMGSYINIQDRSTGIISCYDSGFQQVASGLKDIFSEPEGISADDYRIFSENGQQGLADAAGNVLIAPAYRYMDFPVGNYTVVSTGEKEGLLDLSGNLILPAQFDSVMRSYNLPADKPGGRNVGYVANGYVMVEEGNKTGYCDVNGTITCEPSISSDILENNGASCLYVDMEGKQHVLAADGADTVIGDYENVYALTCASGMLYKIRDENYDTGLLDWHGNELLPTDYSDMSVSGDGAYLLVNVDTYTSVLYKISYRGPEYSGGTAPVQEEIPGESPETETARTDLMPEAASQLLATVSSLMSADFEANRQTVGILLKQASGELESAYPDAAAMLNSAAALTEGGADAGSIGVLIDSVWNLL